MNATLLILSRLIDSSAFAALSTTNPLIAAACGADFGSSVCGVHAPVSQQIRYILPVPPTRRRAMLNLVTNPRLQRGMASEDLAAEYVQARGITILARNLRCRAGELDLVGLENDILVIIEVRQRARQDFGGALASVTREKQRKIIRATQFFLCTHPQWSARTMRFDVLGIDGLPDGAHQIAWIKNAFRAN
jgi:putative endonuclease